MELTTPSATAKAPDSAFTGDVYVNPIKRKAEPSRLIASIVQLPPAHAPTGTPTPWGRRCSARTGRSGRLPRRHRHPPHAGTRSGPRRRGGHWHGAGVDCMMCHIAMLEGVEDGDGTTW